MNDKRCHVCGATAQEPHKLVCSRGVLAEATNDELDKLAAECATANWDGCGAKAVSTASVENARRFLSLLPPDIPAPELSCEPTGDVCAEWGGVEPTVAIIVGSQGMLFYSAITANITAKGRAETELGIPAELIDIIHWVTKGTK